MKEKGHARRPILATGFLILLVAFFLLGRFDPVPALWGNSKAEIDLSQLDRGLVRARILEETDVRIKFQVTKADGIDYNYDLNNTGAWESFTLTEGEGEYTLRVMENLKENRYTPVLSYSLTLSLEDPRAPFLESTQFVRFGPDSVAVSLAKELTAGLETEEEKIETIFDYVVDNVSYDEEKTLTAQPGYIPDVDQILAEGKGICFDYAALTAAMLRSQDIACKLVMGDAGKQYHAWVEVWHGEEGWALLDPTFVSANPGNADILDFVADKNNYRAKYCY